MRILIFGAGAIGSLFGGLLSKYCDVTLLGRGEHIKAIKRRGLVIQGESELHCYPKALSKTDRKFDFIILAVKSYHTLEACKQLKKNLTKGSFVLSIQNGLNEEILVKELGKENVVRGITNQGVYRLGSGKIYHAGRGITVIGELDGVISDRVKKISKIFKSADIETKITKNIVRAVWLKTIINACINPLTALTGLRNGAILSDRLLRALAEEICKESIKVANKFGNFKFCYSKVIKNVFEVAKATKNNKSSMLQDIESGKRTEIDFINGKIVETGKGVGIETTLNSAIVELVKGLESGAICKQ
ncbi:MAG: 2-dehydropantoate 2-reductase [Candidatus Thermoplasmatota archaeon]|nr:2-dehydropantoate 2-reductase [Candidatus Thermoplasmatota archaeon]